MGEGEVQVEPAARVHVVDRWGRFAPAERLRYVPVGRTPVPSINPGSPWDLSETACVGALHTGKDAADALLAAIRGAVLVVGPVADEIADAFVEELRRLVHVSDAHIVTPENASRSDDADLDALLAALAEGLSVTAAARRALMSLRTAHRRLAEARSRAHAPTTAALVAEWARGRTFS